MNSQLVKRLGWTFKRLGWTLPVTHTSGEAFLCPGTPGSLTSGVEGKEKEEKKAKEEEWEMEG